MQFKTMGDARNVGDEHRRKPKLQTFNGLTS